MKKGIMLFCLCFLVVIVGASLNAQTNSASEWTRSDDVTVFRDFDSVPARTPDTERVLPAQRTDDPSAFPTIQTGNRIEQNPVLIVQDVNPWTFTSIQQILTGAGIGFDMATSAAIPDLNLGPYELVIIPSVQPDAFYTAFNTHIAKFENYVTGGGKLWMSGCIYSTTNPVPLIPGGVILTFSLDNYNVVAEPGHPWISGVPNPMYGNFASHNFLTDLLSGTVVVTTAQSSGEATLIEYNLGAGHVAVTGQALEYAWHYSQDPAPILPQSLLYMFHFKKPWILHLNTTDTEQSVRRALTELGYPYYYRYIPDNWTGIDFSPYDIVLIGMDGGLISQSGVQKIRTDVIDQGKRAFFIGGTGWHDFVLGVNNNLVESNTTNYGWKISDTPHLTITDTGHPLAAGLPASYNFITTAAAYYMLRVTDQDIDVVADNGDGHPALFYKRQSFPALNAGTPQTGDLIWLTNSVYEGYWGNQADFNVLKQIIANGLSYISAVDLVYPGDGMIVEVPDDAVEVTMQWHPSQPAVTNYQIDVALNPEFSGWVYTYADLSDTMHVFTYIEDNTTYYWRVRARNASGWGEYSGTWSFTVVVVGIDDYTGNIPADYSLMQNYPNPFNPSTTIRYGLPERSSVKLEIYNALGQRVAVLVNTEIEAGYHEVLFNASHLPSGVYIYRLRAGEFVESRKLLYLK